MPYFFRTRFTRQANKHECEVACNAPESAGGPFRRGQEWQYAFPWKKTIPLLIALCSIFHSAFGQTTRTNPSASSTSPTIPFTSSTSPNVPCIPSNLTSPCYASKSPRNPCYSAVAPNQPCSTTTTPSNPEASSTPLQSPKTPPPAVVHALTQDQARAQIEAKGYSGVSGLRLDHEGHWLGRAEKDGSLWNVTLDDKGKVTAN